MSEQERETDEGTEREETIEDLDVPEEEGRDVSGGLTRGVDENK